MGSCSLERNDAGCPFFAPPRSLDRSGVGGGRQAPTGAVLRVLAPLDGSGYARGTHELLRIRRHRGAPTLRGLVSCRSRPWSRPSELSLPEEPYPLSRASCFLAGSRSTCPTARHEPRSSRPLSPARRPLAAAGPKAGWTGRPGRRFPGVARTLRVTRYRARLQRPRLDSAGLAGYGGRHARFEALLPSRVRSIQRSPPWPGDERSVGALLGFASRELPTSCPVVAGGSPRRRHPASLPARRARGFPRGLSLPRLPSRVLSSSPQVRSARGRTRPGTNPILTRPRELDSWPHVRQVRAPVVGPRTHDPPTCPVDRTGDTPPSGGDPACGRFREAPTRRSPAPPGSRGGCYPPKPGRDVLPAPPLRRRPAPLAPFLRAPPARVDTRPGHRDARSRSASGPTRYRAGRLFWAFAPHRTNS